MKFFTIKLTFIAFLALVFLNGCGTDENTGANNIGNNFVEAELLAEVNGTTALNYVKGFGIDVNATTAFAYKAIKITYNTKDEQDNSVEASGLLIIPTITPEFLLAYKTAYNKDFSISLIAENHGTIFTNAEAPTNEITTAGSNTHISTILMTAKAGFAIAIPDYLGYGVSNDEQHPYILKKSSAQVSIDMLKASTKYMVENGILFNGQVYISGYSEGGYVAMAMAQEIEANYSDQFNLKGIAPMAGPYDLESLAIKEVNATRVMEYPAFLAYLTQAYANVYDDINLSELINYPNTDTFNQLFNGALSGPAINVSLGFGNGATTFGFKSHTADQLWKTTFINDFINNENNTFKTKLAQNNVYNWTPRTKMNLIHCIDDEIIPFSMAQTAYNTFIANGVSTNNLTLSPIPTSYLSQQVDATHPFVHSNCGATAYGAAVTWFNQIRTGEIQ
jgi:predicted esterase